MSLVLAVAVHVVLAVAVAVSVVITVAVNVTVLADAVNVVLAVALSFCCFCSFNYALIDSLTKRSLTQRFHDWKPLLLA